MENEEFQCHYTVEQRKEHEKRFLAEKPKDCMDSIDHPSGVKVGDMVVVRNAYDILVGPYKVLGFTAGWRNNEPRMYLDWDCWWYPAKLSNLYKIM